MPMIYSIFKDCTSKDKDPELRMSMFTLLGQFSLIPVNVIPGFFFAYNWMDLTNQERRIDYGPSKNIKVYQTPKFLNFLSNRSTLEGRSRNE